MFLKRFFSVCITVVSLCMATPMWAGQVLDRIAATVNDEAISISQLNKQVSILKFSVVDQSILPPAMELKKQLLEKLILDRIQLQQAKKAKLEVLPQEVNALMQEQAEQKGLSVKELEQALQKAGITKSDYYQYLQDELLIQQLHQREVVQEVAVSNSEIDSFLNSPEGQDHTGTEYHLGHILLILPEAPSAKQLESKRQEAEALVAGLQQGDDFAKVAMAKSSDRFALQGGDFGWKKISEIPTLFVKHIPSLSRGEILGPIQSSSGFHIVKLLDKRIGEETLHVETEVRQILIKPSANTSSEEAKKSLEKIRQQVLAGDNFAKIAEKSSEELSSAARGGSLGWITEDRVVPLFAKVMNDLKVNELSQPFQTSLGWHLIQVTGRRDQSTSIQAAKNKAYQVVFHRKASQMLDVWLKRIRDEAKVTIYL